MIAIFGSGIIGLFTAHKLLEQGKKVKIFEYKNNEGNATDASVGMLAPLVEAKPYEKKLFKLMIESKKIWDNFLKDKKFTIETGLKSNSSLLIATNNDEIYQILISLRAHGWTRNLPKNNLITGTKSDDDFEESFKFVLPGYNLRPIELSGAIGIEQVKKLDQFIETRRKNALHFKSIMDDNPFS